MRLLTPLAEQGDIASQLLMYRIYRFGQGRTTDMARASYWLEQAIAQAEQGPGAAQWQLYEHYQCDEEFGGPCVDNENTRYWLIAAADSGHPEAMFELSMKYRAGAEDSQGRTLFDIDLKKANYWLDQAVAREFPFALTFKSFFYFDENGEPTDKAIALLKRAEALGDLEAPLYLARVRH